MPMGRQSDASHMPHRHIIIIIIIIIIRASMAGSKGSDGTNKHELLLPS